MGKGKNKKSGWKNDEFDDFRSAGEDSEDVNYNPTAPKKNKPKGPDVRKMRKLDEANKNARVKEALEDIEREKEKLEKKKHKKDKEKKKKHKHKKHKDGRNHSSGDEEAGGGEGGH